MSKRRTHPAGFTLIESLMAISVLAFAVIAISQAISAGQMETYEALHHERAMAVAQALMEEVLALPYADPDDSSTTAGPETGQGESASSRSTFDNCDDFHNYSESTGNVADHAGVAYTGQFTDFSRAVTAAYETKTITGFSGSPSFDGLTVTISITDTRGQQWSVTRFIPEPI